MKRTAFRIALIFTVLQCSAQSWCPPGATWYYQYSSGPMLTTYGHVLFEVVGDTVLAGQTTKRLDRSTHMYYFGTQVLHSFGMAPIFTHASDGVAWIYDQQTATYDTLYHFNAVPGDHWKIPQVTGDFGCDTTSRMLVTDTGTTVIDGIPLRWLSVDFEYYVAELELMLSDTIYERIGGLDVYMLATTYCLFAVDGSEGGALRCYEDDEINYTRVDGPCDTVVVGINEPTILRSVDIFPNPCTTQATVNWPAGTPVEQFTLTDASGRIVRQWKPSTRTAAQQPFSVEDLASGMYTVSCTTSGGRTLAAKLVVR